MLQIPELLAPAGDLERLRYAINYGADAVYCSLPEFGMRSAPANFTPEQLTEGVIYAHARGRKVYLTMNTLPTNEEADRLPDAIKEAAKAGVDAFIVADLGVLDACKTVAPDIDVHMSTQTGITNWAAARAAYNLGAKRVVLAREMSLQDIAILRDKTPPELEIEAFVHGAMCMSVSGRCLLSSYMAGRSGNRGACAQPCRMQYSMGGRMDEYPLSLRDNCLADYLQQLADAGVACVKIEGRMKRPEYVAVVTDVYARCIHEHRVPTQEENDRLALAFSRQGFTQGYLLGKKGPDMLGTRAAEPDREAEKMFTAARKAYADGEGMENDLNVFFAQITPNKYLEERIFTSIVSKDELADAASPELASIRRKIRRQSVAIREGLQKIITSPTYAKFLQEPIVTIRSDRFVVPVKAECKGSIPGLVHDVSSSGSTFFIEPMQAVNGNNALRELFVEERKEIERILTELSGEVAGHREHLAINYTVLTQLDCIFARAKLSFVMKATEPEIRTDGRLELKRARHPLITGKTVVPISVRLGSDFDTLIITGPNTGGKTVSLKTLGLFALMTQAGLRTAHSGGRREFRLRFRPRPCRHRRRAVDRAVALDLLLAYEKYRRHSQNLRRLHAHSF